MKYSEVIKCQKIVEAIQSGSFDENDIDNLLIKLRDYSRGNNLFNEVAHFVAHSKDRDRGINHKALEAYYLRMKFYAEYQMDNTPQLNLFQPSPAYIKKLMHYQIENSDGKGLYKKFGTTKKGLKSGLEKLLIESRDRKTVCIDSNSGFAQNIVDAINYIMQYVYTVESFSLDNFLKEVVNVLKINNISFDEVELLAQRNKIIMCILWLLHDTKFTYKDLKPAYFKISSRYTQVVKFPESSEGEGEIIPEDGFGNLNLIGYVDVEPMGKNIAMGYPFLNTNLRSEEWCDGSMYETI